mgnify:CR=1 FL=1
MQKILESHNRTISVKFRMTNTVINTSLHLFDNVHITKPTMVLARRLPMMNHITVLAANNGLNTNDGQVVTSTEHKAASDGNGANCHVLL